MSRQQITHDDQPKARSGYALAKPNARPEDRIDDSWIDAWTIILDPKLKLAITVGGANDHP